jgi:hypothetical protein
LTRCFLNLHLSIPACLVAFAFSATTSNEEP